MEYTNKKDNNKVALMNKHLISGTYTLCVIQ